MGFLSVWFVHLTRYASFDLFFYILSYVWPGIISTEEFKSFGDTRMSCEWRVVVLGNEGNLFFQVFYDCSQDG